MFRYFGKNAVVVRSSFVFNCVDTGRRFSVAVLRFRILVGVFVLNALRIGSTFGQAQLEMVSDRREQDIVLLGGFTENVLQHVFLQACGTFTENGLKSTRIYLIGVKAARDAVLVYRATVVALAGFARVLQRCG